MTASSSVLWGMLCLAVLASLYGTHRLGVWLENRGWIYYWHKKPSGGGSCFVPLHEILDPSARHVQHIQEERQ